MGNNPYQAPTSVVPDEAQEHGAPLRWKRVLGWAVLILASVNIIAFCSGLTVMYWEIYGDSFEEALANCRRVRRVVIFLVIALLYWRFAAGVHSRRFLHVLAVFITIQSLHVVTTMAIFRQPLQEMFDTWGLTRAFLAALIGYAIAWRVSPTSQRMRPIKA